MLSRRVFLKNGAFAFVSLGFAPSFLARTAVAGRPAARKQLIAIFQRGAVDGLSVVVPLRRGRLLPRAAEHRDSAPGRRRRRGHRSRRLLRLQPAAAAAQAALGRAAAGHRPRLRIARQHALALRRAGLHGDRDARREEHGGRLAEPLSAGAARRARDAVPRRRADAAAAAHAAGHGAGARGQPARAVRHPRRPVERRGRRVVRGRVRGRRRRGAERHRPRGVRRDQDAEDRRPVEVPAGQRRRVSAQRRSARRCGRSRSSPRPNVGLEVAFADVGGWDTHVNQGAAQGQLADRLDDFSRVDRRARRRPRRSHGRHRGARRCRSSGGR